MNRRGLSKAGRWEQGAADGGKLLYRNRLERGRSHQTGKATNTSYYGQEYAGFSLLRAPRNY